MLRDVDLRCRILDSFAECFTDRRHSSYCDHDVRQMLAQRAYGICLGYEDINDHEQLRYDPLFANSLSINSFSTSIQITRRRKYLHQGLGPAEWDVVECAVLIETTPI